MTGLSQNAFTLLHVLISLIGIIAGLIALGGVALADVAMDAD